MKSRVAALALLLVAAGASVVNAQQTYTLTHIIVPSSPYGGVPAGLSQDGWAVGNVPQCCNEATAWLWQPGTPNGTAGTVTESDVRPYGGQAMFFTGVQNARIVGYYTLPGWYDGIGFVLHADSTGHYDADDGLISCQGDAGYTGPGSASYGSWPYGVNATGDIAGQTHCPQLTNYAAGGFLRAAEWSSPYTTVAQTLFGESVSYAINNAGVMTGNGTFGTSPNAAFIGSIGGGVQLVPTIPNTVNCTGVSINDANEAVGTCITNPTNGTGPRAWAFIGGQFIQFGCDASNANCVDAYAYGINNHSVVVGTMGPGGFIWDSVHGARQLSTLVPGSPEISSAVAINDAGQILAVCGDYGHGTAQPCLLTPTPTSDLSIAANPASNTVTIGDAMNYTFTVTNGGPDAATGVTLTSTLPAGLSFVQALTSNGACSGTSTITCAIGGLAASGAATVTIATTATSAGTLTVTASVSGDQADPSTSNNSASTATTINRKHSSVTWAAPAAIVYGTALSASQLNASADTAGTFAYTPTAGTVLHAGTNQGLSVTFTPTSSDYDTATATVTLTVNPAPLTISADAKATVYGAPLQALTASYAGFVNGDTAANLTTPPALSTTATSGSGAGAYPISVGGAVDPDYAIAYVAGTLTIAQANTTAALAASPNPSTAGQSVTLTASVVPVAPGAGHPTGSVTFTDAGSPIGSAGVDAAGHATFATSALGVGSHALAASYGGDANFIGSVSPAVTDTVTAVVTGTPRQTKIVLLAQLQALRATVHDRDAGRRLDEAIGDVTASLEPSLWNADGRHLNVRRGEAVFELEARAARTLDELLDGRDRVLDAATVRRFVDGFAGVDRQLAAIAIGDAGSRWIGDARRDLDEGDAELARGRVDTAFEHYRDAWQDAVR